jgi:CBS domain-containing protein
VAALAAGIGSALAGGEPLSHFAVPVELYMTSPVHSVRPEEDLRRVQELVSALSVSSLPVVDEAHRLVGVISLTDLLRVGRRQTGLQGQAPLLTLPRQRVAKHMTSTVLTIGLGDTLELAAALMLRARVHRVFVMDGERLAGVLSTLDLMRAVRDKRANHPLSEFMSAPIFSVRAEEPISLATERLEKAHVRGLVVLDDDWPVGIFTQREALEARDLSRETPVEQAMSYSILVLDAAMPVHRAAAQAAALRVRRVVAANGRRIAGVLTGLDFARVVT